MLQKNIISEYYRLPKWAEFYTFDRAFLKGWEGRSSNPINIKDVIAKCLSFRLNNACLNI